MANGLKKADSAHRNLSYNGNAIGREKNGMISLTDMWKASGSPAYKDPSKWLRLEVTSSLIEALQVNVRPAHILRQARGRNGGTWACVNLAVSYAKYLSPDFHKWANQVIVERMEEEADPELGIVRSRKRAVNSYKRAGKTDRWIQKRLEIIDTRNHFTDTLQRHGVHDIGYAQCTNEIYKPLFGGPAAAVKLERGLSPKQNLRDHMTLVELASVGLSEALADESIEKRNLYGQSDCACECRVCGIAVAKAVNAVRLD